MHSVYHAMRPLLRHFIGKQQIYKEKVQRLLTQNTTVIFQNVEGLFSYLNKKYQTKESSFIIITE